MMQLRVSAALIVCVSLAAGAGAQVVNGGFEPGPGGGGYQALPGGSSAVPGWITSDTGVEWFLPSNFGYTNSPDGGYAVDLANTIFSAGGIFQSFATTPAQSYQVSFWFGSQVASGRDGTAEITVSAAATTQNFSITTVGSDITWEARTFSFVANSTTTTLSFRCTQDAFQHFAYIDGASVPAPGAAMLGFVPLAGLARRGRRR
jgi:hypothetical protein